MSSKNSTTAFLLCMFLGWLGAHRFYCGRGFTGTLYLLTLGFVGIGVIIDMFRIAYGYFKYHEKNRLGAVHFLGGARYDDSIAYYIYEIGEAPMWAKVFCWIFLSIYVSIIILIGIN